MNDFPRRIIHFDPDPVIQASVKNALSRTTNATLISCSTEDEMLGQLENFDPQLVILDITMNKSDARDTLDALYARGKLLDRPMVILTGHKNLKMRDEYRKLGVIGILHNPIQQGIFPERIRYMWAEYHRNK